MTSQPAAATGMQAASLLAAAPAADSNEPSVLHTKAPNVQSKPEPEPVACAMEMGSSKAGENSSAMEKSPSNKKTSASAVDSKPGSTIKGEHKSARPGSSSSPATQQVQSSAKPSGAGLPAQRSPKFQKTPYECFVTAFRKEFRKGAGGDYDEKAMRKKAHENWSGFSDEEKVVFQEQAELLQQQRQRKEQKVSLCQLNCSGSVLTCRSRPASPGLHTRRRLSLLTAVRRNNPRRLRLLHLLLLLVFLPLSNRP